MDSTKYLDRSQLHTTTPIGTVFFHSHSFTAICVLLHLDWLSSKWSHHTSTIELHWLQTILHTTTRTNIDSVIFCECILSKPSACCLIFTVLLTKNEFLHSKSPFHVFILLGILIFSLGESVAVPLYVLSWFDLMMSFSTNFPRRNELSLSWSYCCKCNILLRWTCYIYWYRQSLALHIFGKPIPCHLLHCFDSSILIKTFFSPHSNIFSKLWSLSTKHRSL